jgi:Circularly permutated YpsA SLOG family
MLERVISGGQAGADRAGWRAAQAHHIATGGWMPRGFPAEDGPHPEFAALYGARELATDDYPARTRANVRDSDATLLFADDLDADGSRLTLECCLELSRPCLALRPSESPDPGATAAWIAAHPIRILNVAGSRESVAPAIGAWVERHLTAVLAHPSWAAQAVPRGDARLP